MQLSTRESGIPAPAQGERYTPSHALRSGRRLGVGIEFTTGPSGARRGMPRNRRGLWPEDLDADARREIVREAAQLGVPITSLSSDWVWAYSEFHPTLDTWARGRELLARDLDLTADLGARVCLIHFAHAQGTWEQAKRLCAAAADAAARRGVIAAFEGSLWQLTGLGPIDELLRLVDELDHPGFRVYAHPRGPGRTCADEILKIGAARLACVHHTRFEPDVDYAAFGQALREVGYAGPLVFECGPDDLERSVPAIRAAGL